MDRIVCVDIPLSYYGPVVPCGACTNLIKLVCFLDFVCVFQYGSCLCVYSILCPPSRVLRLFQNHKNPSCLSLCENHFCFPLKHKPAGNSLFPYRSFVHNQRNKLTTLATNQMSANLCVCVCGCFKSLVFSGFPLCANKASTGFRHHYMVFKKPP